MKLSKCVSGYVVLYLGEDGDPCVLNNTVHQTADDAEDAADSLDCGYTLQEVNVCVEYKQ